MRWALLALCLLGCASKWRVSTDAYRARPFDVALVPGCPTNADGTPSRCQWRRVMWAAALYHRGSVRRVMPSGAAVHNPFGEARTMAAALRAVGVPPEAIVLETQALHTDQNAGYAIQIARRLGFARVAVATEDLQALAIHNMGERWGVRLVPIPLDEAEVARLLARPPPRVRLAPTPGWSRPAAARRVSVGYYLSRSFSSEGGEAAIPRPPMPEPTLGGR
jgi:hypothetical protein